MFKIGDTNFNTHGTLMKIIQYNKYNDIIVEFQDEYKYRTNTCCQNFKKGKIKNPYDKTIRNVGFIGVGKYKKTTNGRRNNCYDIWYDMLDRCYSDKMYYTYDDKIVCDEWHCLQNFGEWYDNNYYEILGQDMDLDKDILVKGNKIYSPETCVFVPHDINILVNNNKKKRGQYPIGVSYHNIANKYQTRCSFYGTEVHLGLFDTEYEAFQKYKIEKEKYIKEVANKYKEQIPQKLYDALLKYEIDEND